MTENNVAWRPERRGTVRLGHATLSPATCGAVQCVVLCCALPLSMVLWSALPVPLACALPVAVALHRVLAMSCGAVRCALRSMPPVPPVLLHLSALPTQPALMQPPKKHSIALRRTQGNIWYLFGSVAVLQNRMQTN